jgi:hypothetical protein
MPVNLPPVWQLFEEMAEDFAIAEELWKAIGCELVQNEDRNHEAILLVRRGRKLLRDLTRFRKELET